MTVNDLIEEVATWSQHLGVDAGGYEIVATYYDEGSGRHEELSELVFDNVSVSGTTIYLVPREVEITMRASR